VTLLWVQPAAAQQQAATLSPQPSPEPRLDLLKFLVGGALGLVSHEGGHIVFDLAFDAHPRLKRVSLGRVPFFAIIHRGDLSPRREFIIDAAGFWVQGVTSEQLLMTRPSLRSEHAPIIKGEFAFDEFTSIGYGIVAFAKAGPPERDTRGMADSIHVSERLIGGLVIAPALLDGYRYLNPNSRWAAWVSRIVKIGTVVLVLK
jgi:hypothetical protein